MAFHIRNEDTEQLARALADKAGLGLTEVVHMALKAELERREGVAGFAERTRHIVDEVSASVKHPDPLPKTFYDELYE